MESALCFVMILGVNTAVCMEQRVVAGLDDPVTLYRVNQVSIDHILDSLRHFGLDICVEYAHIPSGERFWWSVDRTHGFDADRLYSFKLTNTTPRGVLNQLVRLDSRYRWLIRQGKVCLVPRKGSKLIRQVKDFKFSGQVHEAVAKLALHIDDESLIPGIRKTVSKDVRVSTKLASVFDVLNDISAQHKGLSWSYSLSVRFHLYDNPVNHSPQVVTLDSNATKTKLPRNPGRIYVERMRIGNTWMVKFRKSSR
jgi:hypothetical protein